MTDSPGDSPFDQLPPEYDEPSLSSEESPNHLNGRRKGVALCLSGGGFRAALFHLGALRRLNETGTLQKIDTITSVSGGSIIAAHVASTVNPWPRPGEQFNDWEVLVAAPFRAFTSRDLRTSVFFSRWLPKNWVRPSARAEVLAKAFERLTTIRLSDLPEKPRFVFCATDVTFGKNWMFEKALIGTWMAGYMKPAPSWPVARAVAASSCFPPVFSPLRLNLNPQDFKGGSYKRGSNRDKLVSNLRLTDGGIYDNLGLEPVWKSHDTVLVSDGGATLPFQDKQNLFSLLKRYVALSLNQVSSLRVRWLMDRYANKMFKGAYWAISSSPASYKAQPQGDSLCYGYSKALARDYIATIRTDMDAFTEAEASVLENHGYWMAEAALQRKAPELMSGNKFSVAKAPHPEWMEEDRVRYALRDSHKRKLFGYPLPSVGSADIPRA